MRPPAAEAPGHEKEEAAREPRRATLKPARRTTAPGRSESAAPMLPPAPAVSVATIEPRQATIWDEFSGRLEAVERVEDLVAFGRQFFGRCEIDHDDRFAPFAERLQVLSQDRTAGRKAMQVRVLSPPPYTFNNLPLVK